MELLTGERGGIRKEAEEEETARSGRHTGELFRGSRLWKKCVCVCVCFKDIKEGCLPPTMGGLGLALDLLYVWSFTLVLDVLW